MKKTKDIFISYVLPLILVVVLVGTVVFTMILQKRKTVEYDYQDDVSAVSMNTKTIRVAADIDYAPFSFVDNNNNPSGHDIELMYAIAKREGYNIELSMVKWHEALTGLENGMYDVLISSDYTAGGNNEIFTTPICTDPFGIYGKSGTKLPETTSELQNYRIAALKSGSAEFIFIEPLELDDSVIYYDTITDAFKAVNSGEADFVISSNYTARHIISNNDMDVEQLGSTIYENSMCFMVSKNNQELLKNINKSIVVFQNDGYIDELNDKWFEDYQPDITFKSLISQNKTVFILILAIVVLVIYSAIFMLSQLNKQKEKELSDKSIVTGLPNLNAFRRITGEKINSNPEEEYIIGRIDIDHFKLYNDIYGTDAGDRLLHQIGNGALKIIKNSKVDFILGHVNGDHFVFMQSAVDFSPIRLYNMCIKGLKEIDPNYNFAVRIGYCKVNDPHIEVAVYCDWAYLALKSIKGDYIRHWAEYDKDMRQQIIEEREISDEMTNALANGQFVPFFQPQYNFQTNTISGAEVLVRWKHPKKGMISPAKFIPVFENNGFIYEMDKYIWREACRFLEKLEKEGQDIPSLSINISRRDLFRDDLLATLNSIIHEYKIDKKKLHLEITESAYTDNPELLINVVNELKKDGYIIEMDDFGSGYSSLSILKDLPVNIVKLDMVFLKNSSSIGKTGNIISSMVHMAHQIDLSVIAEGVETLEQAKFLHSIGCYHMQGYYFAKPMDEEAFNKYIREAEFDSSEARLLMPSDDNSVDFLDDRTHESLLFNGFIGSACIVEIQGQHVNVLRVNERFFKELGVEDKADFDILSDITSQFDDESQELIMDMAKKAIETGKEVTGTIYMRPFDNSSSEGLWLFIRERFLGQKVDNYLFFCSVENISEMKQLTKKNEIILNELNNIISNLPGGIARFRYDGKVKYEFMSTGYASMLGYTVNELMEVLNEDALHGIHPDDSKKVLETIRDCIKSGNEINISYRIENKDGEYIWVNTSGLSEPMDGYYLVYLYSADISNEKAIEEKLSKNEVTLANIMSAVSGGTATIEYDGQNFKLTEVSEDISKILDRTQDEFIYAIEHNLGSLIYEQDIDKVLNSIKIGVETGKDADITFRFVKDNEEPVWVRMHAQYEKTNNGVIIHIIFRDVSSTSEFYQNVINETDTGIVVIDKNTHETVFANRAGAAIFEMLPEKLIGKQCYEYCWGNGVHCSLWTDNLPAEGLTIEDEHNGRHYIVHRKSIYWNGIDAIITYYSDRTENYESEKQFSSLISNMPCGISIIEHDGYKLKRTYISEFGKKLIDIDDNERAASLYPEDDRNFVHEDDFDRYIELLNSTSKDNTPFSTEVRVILRNGENRWIELNGQPFYNQDLQKQIIFLTFVDITERKILDEEAKVKEAEYRAAANQSNRMVCRYITSNRSINVLKNVSEKYDTVTYMENAPEEFIRQGYIAKESEEAWRELFNKIDRGDKIGNVNDIAIATLSDRKFKWYNASFETIKSNSGKTEVAVLSFEDITEKKLQERNNIAAYNSVLKALSSVYQVSVACDTTANDYRILENNGYIDDKIAVDGKYDEFISKIGQFISDEEQRNHFCSIFSSKGVTSAWNEGKDKVTYEHQLPDCSGKLHWVETTAIRVDNIDNDDYIHVLVLQIIDDRKESELVLKEELEKSNEDLYIGRQISIISSELTKSGTVICMYDINDRNMELPKWYAEKFNFATLISNYPNVNDEKFVSRFLNQNELRKYLKIFDDITQGIATEDIVVGFKYQSNEIWYKIKSVFIKDEEGRNVKAAISLDDITNDYIKEQTHKKEMESMQAMISTVSQKDIVYLGTIETSTKLCRLYTKTENNRVSIPDLFDYDGLIHMFAFKYVDEADREEYLKNMVLDSIIKGLDEKGIYINQYTISGERRESEYKWLNNSHDEIIMLVRSIQDKYIRDLQLSAQEYVKNQISEFETNDNLSDGLRHLTESIGKYALADRAYVLGIDDNYFNSTVEWADTDTPRIADLLKDKLGKSVEKFSDIDSIYVDNIDKLVEKYPTEYAVLKENNINSFIVCPIRVDGNIIAIIGIDNPNNKQTQLLIQVLPVLGNILGERIHADKQRNDIVELNEKQIQDMNSIISALSNRDCATWIIDMDSNELTPINDSDYDCLCANDAEVYGNATRSLKRLSSDFIPKESEKAMVDFFNFDRIRNYLKDHENDSIEYEGKLKGWTRIVISPATDKDNISKIIVSFIQIADEKQKEAEAEEKLQKVVNELKQADKDKRKDYLTGLYNRYALGEINGKDISNVSAIYMMDIDNFKNYNDMYGHVEGDECLKKIGFALSEYGKSHDTWFYRYGGEEILGISYGDKYNPDVIANELVKLVYDLNIKNEATEYGTVTVSLGYTTDETDINNRIILADEALYKAKASGKNVACKSK